METQIGAAWFDSVWHKALIKNPVYKVVDTHLSETELPSLLLLWLFLGVHPWSSLAFLLCLQELLHASETPRAGPAWPGCCSSPDAA